MTVHKINKLGEDTVDDQAFRDLIGTDLIEILLAADDPIRFRVLKTADHYAKAKKLIGVDDEMGAIRLIAAEEELVVSIFEALKANSDGFPEHADFVKHFKKHPVKLSFYPVLQMFQLAFQPMLESLTIEGLEEKLHWKAAFAVRNGKVVLVISDQSDGRELVTISPLAAGLNLIEEGDATDHLYKDMEERVKKNGHGGIGDFVAVRAEFRNLIFYAKDEGFQRMTETLAEHFESFDISLQQLSWVVGAILAGPPPKKDWGVVSQFMEVYRRVLRAYREHQNQPAKTEA